MKELYAIPMHRNEREEKLIVGVSDTPCPECGGVIWACWELLHYESGDYDTVEPLMCSDGAPYMVIDAFDEDGDVDRIDECVNCGGSISGKMEEEY